MITLILKFTNELKPALVDKIVGIFLQVLWT